jgi:uncharacterized protein (TIGR03435 family)
MKGYTSGSGNYGKLILCWAGFVAVTATATIGVAHAASGWPKLEAQNAAGVATVFDVASIKPNKSGGERIAMNYTPDGFTAVNVTVRLLIRFAYGPIDDNRIVGGEDWLSSERFDIEAKVDSSEADELQKLNPAQLRIARQQMLQALLSERFKLVASHQTRELPVYALVVAKNGPKLKEATPGDTYPKGMKGADGRAMVGLFSGGRGGPLTGQGATMGTLATVLSQQLGRIILDKTGLTGRYDFALQWTPDQGVALIPSAADGGNSSADNASAAESSEPSIFSAIQEQLGLKLEAQKAPVDVLYIGHAEKPSGN